MKQLLSTELLLSTIKESFSQQLCHQLNLVKVSSPIAILDGTGINDDLNGVERPVSFPIKAIEEQRALIVHSLAKWKRLRLMELGIKSGMGILTDMRALRPDEEYSYLHSVYVDQWDWEVRINKVDRSLTTLREYVERIFNALKSVENEVYEYDKTIAPLLPEKIKFIHSQELLDLYPHKSAKERERLITKEHGAVFIMGIGAKLSDREPHENRAPDYDDWSSLSEEGFYGLNGDILVWHPTLECALELSSMGIRVDAAGLLAQLEERECMERRELLYHTMLLDGKLPYSIGGGIGQSRLCMFLLRKRHIGEVQVGVWDTAEKEKLKSSGIQLL